MSNNDAHPDKSGDNDAADSTDANEEDVEIDVNGEFEDGEFVAEANDADDVDSTDSDESHAGLDALSGVPERDELDVDTIDTPRVVNKRVVAQELSERREDVRRVVADDDDIEYIDRNEDAERVHSAAYLARSGVETSGEGELLGSVFARVAHVFGDTDSESGFAGRTRVRLRVADTSGTIDLDVDSRMPFFDDNDVEPGDELLITNLHGTGSDDPPLRISDDSNIVKIHSLHEQHGVGAYLERLSALVNAPEWYANDDLLDAQARENVVEALIDELHFESPYGGEEIWMYIDEETTETFDDFDKQVGTFVRNGDERIREHVDKFLPARKKTSREKTQIVKSIRDKTRVAEDAFRPGEPDDEELKWSVACENGVIDLRTGELHDFAPEWRCKSKIPVAYDGDIDELGDGIESFIDSVTDDAVDRELLIQMVAHSLPRTYPVKSVFIMVGPGDNGKSIWLRVLKNLLDDKQAAMTLRELCGGETDFGSGAVEGVHAVVDDDASGKKVNNVNMLKKLSGGNGAEINKKEVQRYGYESYATIIAATNNPLMIGDKTDSVKGRIKPVRMPFLFTDDPTDGHKTKRPEEELMSELTADEELQALLAVAVQYAAEMHDTGSLVVDRSKEENWRLYKRYSDKIARFWMDCMESETGARVTKSAVYETYVKWCDEEGVEAQSLRGSNNFWQISEESSEISFKTGKWIGDERAIEHVKFDSKALGYAPDWVVDEWEDDVNDDSDTIANNLDRVKPISDLGGGYCTTGGTVLSRELLEGDSKIGVKLVIEDSTTAIDVVEWVDDEDEALLDGIYSGDTIRLQRVTLRKDSGVPQLSVNKRVAEVDTIESVVSDVSEYQGDDSGDGVVDETTLDAVEEHARELIEDESRNHVRKKTLASNIDTEGVVDSWMEATAAVTTLVNSGRLQCPEDGVITVSEGDSV